MNSLKLNSINFRKTIVPFFFNRNIHASAVLCDKSLYEILRVPENATQSEIKQAYYKLSKVYHPDIKQDENSLRMFRNITEAYDVLGNVNKRMQYDKGVLGKNEHYDPVKEDFYGPVVRTEMNAFEYHFKIRNMLDRKVPMDKYLSSEYNDRLAEWRMYKSQNYEHTLKPYKPFDLGRFWILIGFGLIGGGLQQLEFVMCW